MKPISFVLPLTHLASIKNDVGWGNGYVAVPEGHAWYGKDYDDIDADAHGGLTFSGDKIEGQPEETKGMWIVGFDCAHYMDNPQTCPESYVRAEAEDLLQQALQAK